MKKSNSHKHHREYCGQLNANKFEYLNAKFNIKMLFIVPESRRNRTPE